jgi:hypothetical protein
MESLSSKVDMKRRLEKTARKGKLATSISLPNGDHALTFETVREQDDPSANF